MIVIGREAIDRVLEVERLRRDQVVSLNLDLPHRAAVQTLPQRDRSAEVRTHGIRGRRHEVLIDLEVLVVRLDHLAEVVDGAGGGLRQRLDPLVVRVVEAQDIGDLEPAEGRVGRVHVSVHPPHLARRLIPVEREDRVVIPATQSSRPNCG